MDCWSETCSSWLTSTKSCSKQKWHEKVLWKQFLCLGQSNKYLNFHESYGVFWSHGCPLAVAGKAVSRAETPDVVQQPEQWSWVDGCMKWWATAWPMIRVLCNSDLNHSDMNIWRSQHHAGCSPLLKGLILAFSTIYLETYANLKFT